MRAMTLRLSVSGARCVLVTAIVCGFAAAAHAQQCDKAPPRFTVWFIDREIGPVLPTAIKGDVLSITLTGTNQAPIALSLRPCANPDLDPGVLASYRVTLILRGGTNGVMHLVGMGDRPALPVILKPCDAQPYEETLETYAAASVASHLAAEIDAFSKTGARQSCDDVKTAVALFNFAIERLKRTQRTEENQLRASLEGDFKTLEGKNLCAPTDLIALKLKGASPVTGRP